jgi:hypothetical protein
MATAFVVRFFCSSRSAFNFAAAAAAASFSLAFFSSASPYKAATPVALASAASAFSLMAVRMTTYIFTV